MAQMVGRRPKPTRLKLLAGNPGRRPLRADEPEPEVAIPEPPKFLSPEALLEWRRITPLLERLELVSQLDRAALSLYCQAWGRWVDAEKIIGKTGLMVESPSGHRIQSPHLAIANRAIEQLDKILVEFGMTPSSRSRVGVGKASEKRGDDKSRFFDR